MKKFTDWSIRYKLLSLLLFISVSAFAAAWTIAYLRNLQDVERGADNQLTSVRRSKASQLESYYQTIFSHVQTLSEDFMFIDAMRQFDAAYLALDTNAIPAEDMGGLFRDYSTQFYPEMQKRKLARPAVQDYLPYTPAGIQLQYLYIAKNPYPAGKRRELNRADDNSDYSRVHAKYHRAFERIAEKFGYYDLYLIDNQGNSVYDVNKDRDFATNYLHGIYQDSNLAKLVRQCLATKNPDDVFLSDFEPYQASFGEPTQYVASPIFDGDERVGIFALQLSTQAIENVVTGDRGWIKDGLGLSGETIIYGADSRLRTNVRSYLEDPEGFLAQRKGTVSDKILNQVRDYKTTILYYHDPLSTVANAAEGKQGTEIERAQNSGTTYLVSYGPLHIPGVHWVIISRVRLDEMLQPIGQMQRQFAWWGAGMLLLAVVASLLAARVALRPVQALVKAARSVGAGDLTAHVDWKWKDELGILADTFNSMTRNIREDTELIEQKNRENEALLLNILPGEIAARLKTGEREIADSFADVTVLFGDIVGFTTLSSKNSAPEIVDMLNDLFSRFDQAAKELGIEKIKTIGDCYMAVCGLPKTCPDHADRMARMALCMLDATRQSGEDKGLNLQMRIGMNSGRVVAGVIGRSKFIYDLWGDTVNIASRMESTGVPGQIQVTESVYNRLKDGFEFESRGLIQVKGKGELETWLLHSQIRVKEAVA
ncbi:MAG TPA: adenylate/guanylate cyclase domain-containing protein [Terriglobales bacterium]|jgi:class 3 adenylate cyclase|nr:adenylate/guanylate cyclase domain-containing protein [Terriglobales bacterium]